MAKTSQIEKIIAGLQAEKDVIDGLLMQFGSADRFHGDVSQRSDMLGAFIVRLTDSMPTAAPKPPRTRKSRKATEPSL